MNAAAGSASPHVVETHGVGKVFETGDAAVTALDGIDLTIRSGEFVSLIGPSGCGKSTLLRIIGDLTDPSGGELRVNGKSALRVLEGDPAAGLIVMRRLAGLIARYLASSGAK